MFHVEHSKRHGRNNQYGCSRGPQMFHVEHLLVPCSGGPATPERQNQNPSRVVVEPRPASNTATNGNLGSLPRELFARNGSSVDNVPRGTLSGSHYPPETKAKSKPAFRPHPAPLLATQKSPSPSISSGWPIASGLSAKWVGQQNFECSTWNKPTISRAFGRVI